MMKIKFNYIIISLLTSLTGIAQVGINTTTPRGALDINTTTTGFVYPVVSLVNTTTETITNPNAANIIAGTTVYNEVSTNAGATSVYPGIYVWDGSKWVPQFNKREDVFFEQNANVRTQSSSGAQSILFDDVAGSPASSFTPTYSGNYLVEVKIHFGAGAVDTPGTSNSNDVNFNAQVGKFDFTFNGNTKTVNIRSYSAENDRYSAYKNSASQVRFVVTENLANGTSYPFALTCDQEPAEGFKNNGNSGSGRGYVFINGNVKCTIEFTYIDE